MKGEGGGWVERGLTSSGRRGRGGEGGVLGGNSCIISTEIAQWKLNGNWRNQLIG